GEGERAERRAACRQRRHDRPYFDSVLRGQRLELVPLDHALGCVEQVAARADRGDRRTEPRIRLDAEPVSVGGGRSGGRGRGGGGGEGGRGGGAAGRKAEAGGAMEGGGREPPGGRPRSPP